MRLLLLAGVLSLCSGCATISTASRIKELRAKTTELRVGMYEDELVAVLGEPTSKEGARCGDTPDLIYRTCQRWTYDPSEGWPLTPPNTRWLHVFLVPHNERLRVVMWDWELRNGRR